MGNKLWPYSGSAFSKAAAFLTGINFRLKIRELIDSIEEDATLQNIPITQFRQGWIKEADEFESIVKAQIQTIVRNLSGIPDQKAKCGAESIKEKEPCDLFDSLFQSNNEPSLLTDVNIDALLAEELERFERYRQPRADVQTFWKTADFVILRRVARIILSVPASSATIERLFSEAGIVLTKLRRRLDPEKLSALIYIKYASMYSDLYKDIRPSGLPEDDRLKLVENMIVESQDDASDNDGSV